MVSPCVDSRLNDGTKAIHCLPKSTHKIFGSSMERSAPASELHFSAPKTDPCGHPKHKTYSDARGLGNVRRNGFISGPNDLLSTKAKATALLSASHQVNRENSLNANGTLESRPKLRQTSLPMRRKDSVGATAEKFHFTGNSEKERRRQMTNTLNAMLSGPKPRRDSLKLAFARELYRDQVLDARKDEYRVHKWRQRSSRRKLAGMYGSPEEIQVEKPSKRVRHTQKDDGSIVDYQNSALNDFAARKPRVPLPGVNLLPALYIRDRSDAGSREPEQQEVTLSFARNAAMEELERRFHDDRWKGKKGRARKSKARHTNAAVSESVDVGGDIRSTRRNLILRHAASLKLGPADVEGNQRPSAMHTLESLIESPDKRMLDDIKINEENVPPDLQPKDRIMAGGTPSTEAITYKMIKDNLSEETVTIVSKSSDAASPAKYSASFPSKVSVPIDHAAAIPGAYSLKSSQKASNSVGANSSKQTSERRFPILPGFPKAAKIQAETDERIFTQLRQTMQMANEQQYQKFSRRQKSIDLDDQLHAVVKLREQRVVLPPINVSAQPRSIKPEIKRDRRSQILDEGHANEHADSISPLGSSPTRKKPANSSKTSPLSYASAGGLAKDTTTPVDSISSKSTGGRRKSNKWRRRSVRGDSKGSPQFQRAQKQTKVAKLMSKWKTAIRLAIMFGRLCDDHHMVTDDSYNIHFARTRDSDGDGGTKAEVLFDVTDYKTKNQLRLSDTARRVLSTPSDERTHQDVRSVQTALRNIKAIADHSSAVQYNIARYGYFASFGAKRVVVWENRPALNYYVLMAGSAVVIKSDENGNTSPAWFMKRGDVFGEKEILNNDKWEWSVVTVDSCEFLLLNKEEYLAIFLAGGSGGLLNDPDRGTFLKNLSLFRGWPMQLLASNPNRCLFRYYKRGALLSKDNAESDWIYVVKSGSCSVLKPLKVQKLTAKEIFRRQMAEQTATLPVTLLPQLVQREEEVSKEEHLERIAQITEAYKADQLSVATSYKQIEMATLLKELNIDIKEGILTPVDEEDESDEIEEEPVSQKEDGSENTLKKKTVTINVTEGDIEPYIPNQMPPSESNEEFRLSRVSDRTPARTPSPMKAAYLQTGISSSREENSRRHGDDRDGKSMEESINIGSKSEKQEPAGIVTETQVTVTDNLSADDFLSKLDSSSESDESRPPSNHTSLKPVYVDVRKLTRGCSFGLGPVLFNDQPSLALMSNGAECLLLNKKFYLDNMTDEVLKNLRDVEHPYPSESELRESYWRLISWKAFQQRTVQGILRHKTKVKHYMNPPKTDVY